MLESTGLSLVVLGLLLLGGAVAHVVSVRAAVPRVTILLVIGALCGPSVLDLVPQRVLDWFPLVAQLALAMVGFLLGESFAGKHLHATGRVAFAVSVSKAVAASLAVLALVRLAGGSWPLALLLAGIAPATAPAAILETVRETDAKGPLTSTVLEVVAIDDAWGILLFSVLLVSAQGLSGDRAPADSVLAGLWHVGGAVLLGVAIGLPMAWLTGRIRDGALTLVEASGFVFLCAGLAEVVHASYLLATMTLGAVIANRTAAAARPFHAIDRVREPFLAVFFLLAGLELDLGTLGALGLVGAAYVIGRIGAFVTASSVAAKAVSADDTIRRNIGWCLIPQAGVAMGLALLAEREVESIRGQVLPLVVATTILFELVGPLVLRWRLSAAGETSRARANAP